MAPVTRWLGDFLRFWWALGYWNLRKTWFRLRGAVPTDCPCHNPSDSGLPRETRCEAVATWNSPARFRRVCPLLVATADGHRCSVAASAVRPFWGRAFAYAGTATLVVYLGLAGVAYFGLKRIGYEVGLTSVLWPGHWSEIRTAQERLYARRAQSALAAGDFPAAVLALETVTTINPRNQAASLALANLWQISGRASLADGIYQRLMIDFPAQRIEFARLWYRALLARGDYTRIKQLAPQLLLEDSASRAAWLHALVFATRRSSDPAPLQGLLDDPRHLPSWCLLVLTLELDLQTQAGRHAAALGRVAADPGSPYVPLYQAERLIATGRAAEAVALLKGYEGRVPVDEAGFRLLEAYTLLGWSALAEGEAEILLSFPMRPQLAAQFSAYLIRRPDPELQARFVDRFVRDGPRPDPDSLAYYAAAHLAAIRCGDNARAAYLADILRSRAASDFRALGTLGEILRQPTRGARLEQVLPAVPLPTEVYYALHVLDLTR